MFYPIDSIKTRLQSPHGFYKAGGFRGIYNGVGSVIVGSAPGGKLRKKKHLWLLKLKTLPKPIVAAVFFATYDTLKRTLPTSPHLAPVNHMLSATVGEVVRDANA